MKKLMLFLLAALVAALLLTACQANVSPAPTDVPATDVAATDAPTDQPAATDAPAANAPTDAPTDAPASNG